MLGLMVFVGTTNAQTSRMPDEIVEVYFYAVESKQQTHTDAHHPKKRRSLQIQPPPIPTLPPIASFTFPPIGPIPIPGMYMV